jgi:glutamate racemase
MIDYEKIKNKDHLKIIVTDSGLGGLSVQALLDKNLRSKTDKKIDLIFYNSLADPNFGYNSIKHNNDKIKVFDSALSGMIKFNPDIILIACNTLSVIYHETEISKSIKIPVIGIVENGIEMIIENTDTKSDYSVIILGTETTINSNQHKLKLVEHGIDENKIVTQACKNLESEIQNSANSNEVEILIEKYVSKAHEKINNKYSRQLVLLACTHYGYSKNIFEKKLQKYFGNNFIILNPNEKMAEILNFLFDSESEKKGEISNKVVSRVKISEDQIKNLAELIKLDSENLAESLKRYMLFPELFQFDKKELQNA